MLVVRDVTRLRSLEDAQALRLQRLSRAAHPLTVLKGYLEMTEEPPPPPCGPRRTR
jgi:two-component system phosphate regulon sensor histidine kinase PhoR